MKVIETPMAVNPMMLASVFRKYGCKILNIQAYGPVGMLMRVTRLDRGTGSVIVTQAEWDNEEWIHASVAWEREMPTYGDLATLHRAVFGRKRWSYQVFAPDSAHVNIHPNALHLWGKADGSRVLPDFALFRTI